MSLLLTVLLAALAQDDSARRIADRVERELRESQTRLREDIQKIVETELRKVKPSKDDPGASKAPPKPAVLGITVDDLSDAERKALGIGGGIKIAEVRGAARKAGLQAGDILLSLGDTPVNEDTIGKTLESCKAGDTVEVTVLRDKKRKTLKVVLGER